ncbi:MAG: formylglycine-generating enzyme family protein [Bacteroidaceae bacterium]|nr:formylglycine-generating enzyme family protein [Bacteroidaceae bacterium]
MKKQALFNALSLLFALCISLPVMAQGVIVYKKDGTQVKYSYEVLDRIETYNYDEEPEVPDTPGSGDVSGSEFDIFASLSYDDMVYVEGGTFLIGAQTSSSSSANYDSDAESDESPVHSVTLSSYYIGKYEVTQQLWEYVMNYTGAAADGTILSAVASDPWLGDDNPSSTYGKGDYYPAYCVSYEDIVNHFIPRLNKITGKTFRLPTEAEWEYAARGGNQSKGCKYSGSNTIGDVAWYTNNASSTTHQVGTKQANELGIYDMSGNVYEWCSDWYGSYSSTSQTDPTGPTSGSRRMLRGGSRSGNARNCRVSNRFYDTPSYRSYYYGFRLVCVP